MKKKKRKENAKKRKNANFPKKKTQRNAKKTRIRFSPSPAWNETQQFVRHSEVARAWAHSIYRQLVNQQRFLTDPPGLPRNVDIPLAGGPERRNRKSCVENQHQGNA